MEPVTRVAVGIRFFGVNGAASASVMIQRPRKGRHAHFRLALGCTRREPRNRGLGLETIPEKKATILEEIVQQAEHPPVGWNCPSVLSHVQTPTIRSQASSAVAGFTITTKIIRFLPYMTKSSIPQHPARVRL